MTSTPPWAMFVLTDNVDVEWLNQRLKKAERNNYGAGWVFWIAADQLNDIPQRTENGVPPQGTKAPLSQDFVSKWVGKSTVECGKWLQQVRDDAAVNRNVFAMVTEHSKEDDSFTACLVNRLSSDDPLAIDVEYFPQRTQESAMSFATNSAAYFYEKATGYRNRQRQRGEIDRSCLREAYDRY